MTIRSFVLRQGRMTDAQEKAFSQYWTQYGIDIEAGKKIDLAELFGPGKEYILEIGFGNGESLIEMAKNNPDKGFLGIEVHRPGVGHIMLRAAEEALDNLRVIRHDAVEILRDYLPRACLTRVQIYFPDPWPKARHHKRRIIQKPFVDLVWSVLKPEGIIHCATDWEHYALWMRDIFLADPKWQNLGHTDGFSERPSWRPMTKFERRGLGKGHGVWDLQYQKPI